MRAGCCGTSSAGSQLALMMNNRDLAPVVQRWIYRQLKVLTVCIFSVGDRTGADLGRFCISTAVFTVDTRTLLDELFDSHGLPGFFVAFESPDDDMLLLESQAAVVDGHD